MSAATNSLAKHAPRLLAHARRLLELPGGPEGELSRAELKRAAAAVEALHEGLVGRRDLAQFSTYDDPQNLGAYLLWWWPQSYAKMQLALSLSPALATSRILDLGAGPGPAALAAIDQAGSAGRLDAYAVDASASALAAARDLSAGALQTVRADLLEALPAEVPGRFDRILLSNVLSELPGGPLRRSGLLRAVVDRWLSPQGQVVVIEPALRETGRALLEVRDALVGGGGLQALAPCLTQKPCPALASAKDWCTADRAWAPPRFVRQLADETGLRADERLSFAFLVLGREARVHPPDLVRVVGLPQPEKGKKRVFVCSDRGRVPLVRLDREASDSNAALEELSRGDRARVTGEEVRADGWRLGPAAKVWKEP